MKFNNVILYVVTGIIVIIGLVVWNFKGFNKELQYSARKQILLSNNTGIKNSDVKKIVSEVLGDGKFMVQSVESFGNAVFVVSEDLTDEQKKSIIEKFNEKYNTELKSEDIQTKSIPSTRVKDVIKKYLIPGIATLALIVIYFIIRYKKIGLMQVVLSVILTPVVVEIAMFSIIAITRIQFGRVAIAIGAGIYMLIIEMLTNSFESKRAKYIEAEEAENK